MDNCDKRIGKSPHNKDKTNKELYGEEKAIEISKKKSQSSLGRVGYWSGKKHSEETKKKMIESALKRKPVSEETKEKLRLSNTGKKLSDDHKRKLSISRRKRPSASEETRNKISQSSTGRHHSEETKEKLREIAHNISEETRYKMRCAANKNLQKRSKFGERVIPSFNFKACEFFDKLSLETETHIQHAMNGGEFKIREFFVDGYDEINNIVYEYDELQHFNIDGTLKNKDIQRQREIEKYLQCKFIRINEKNEIYYENF
jgi:hypothetical protein